MSDPWYTPLYIDKRYGCFSGSGFGPGSIRYGCFSGLGFGPGSTISKFNLIKIINRLNYKILYDEGDLFIFGTSSIIIAYRKIQPSIMNENELDIVKKVMLKLKIKSMP
jgi:hypothetical protein